MLKFLSEADPRLAHDPRLLFTVCSYRLGIVLLDAATLWVLILALGLFASPSGVFASFMIATLLRTIGLLPGGLGTFEATSRIAPQALPLPNGENPQSSIMTGDPVFRILQSCLERRNPEGVHHRRAGDDQD